MSRMSDLHIEMVERHGADAIAFCLSILNPEELGHAVPAHVRDEARRALGRAPVETANAPRRSLPSTS